MAAHTLRGGCHCGALEVEFHTDLATADIGVRACQCPFCRLHGALSASDPKGEVTFRARESDALVRYRFGLKLADFLLCKRCGGYVGAFMIEDGRGLAVVNINVFGERDRFRVAEGMTYDGESVEQRLVRRRERWMPARVEIGAR